MVDETNRFSDLDRILLSRSAADDGGGGGGTVCQAVDCATFIFTNWECLKMLEMIANECKMLGSEMGMLQMNGKCLKINGNCLDMECK